MDSSARRLTAKGVAAARHSGILGFVVVAIPLSSMLTVLTTVAICLAVWRSGPSYAEGLVFPAISELGVDLPQKRIYQAGFAATGAFMAMCILLFEEIVACLLLPLQGGTAVLISGLRSAPDLNGAAAVCQGAPDAASGRVSVRLESGDVKAVKLDNLSVKADLATGPDADFLRSLLRWGYLSAAGVVLQGVFTLERGLSAQCFIHWGGAVLFMVGAMLHAKASNELYDSAAKREVALLQDRGVGIARRMRHFILDYSSVVLFMIPLLMQMLPSSKEGPGKEDASGATASAPGASTNSSSKADFDPAMMNAMGVMQWGIIFQFAVYFCTYTLDLRAAASRMAIQASGCSAHQTREKDS